jgi:putative hydrolase of the HAD superfamily
MTRFFVRNYILAVSICIIHFSTFAMENVTGRYKNIIFDIGGVLIKDAKYFAEKLFEGEKKEKYVSLNKSLEWGQWTKGISTKEQLINAISTAHSLDKDEVRTFVESLLTKRPLIDECWELVEKLKQLGYKLYILSNMSRDTHKASVTGYYKDLFDKFDGKVFSFEEGCIKPDSQIYNNLLKRYGLKPEECLFVDDMEANIATGKKIGINGIVYKEGTLEAAFKEHCISCDK